jgi:hypothetical protein
MGTCQDNPAPKKILNMGVDASKKKHVFLKDILNPRTTTQQRKQVVAESRNLTDVTATLPSYESNRKQPPSLMGLLLLSCLADGPHALLRRVQATFIWLFSCLFPFYASHTSADNKYTKVISDVWCPLIEPQNRKQAIYFQTSQSL